MSTLIDTKPSTGVDVLEVEERNRVVLEHVPLVRFVAKRIAQSFGLPPGVELADLVSYGILGLVEAHARFEEGRGASFETFAIPRIRGAMLDELRRYDWVPRNVRTRARKLVEARTQLVSSLGRDPTREELADAVGVQELNSFERNSVPATLIGLEDFVNSDAGGDGFAVGDTIVDIAAEQPGLALEESERRARLTDALGSLEERDRLILTLYYFEGVPLGEIAKLLGVTESRISQLHTRALAGLRRQLQDA